MMTSVRAAYQRLGLRGWMADKRDDLAMLLGLRTDWMYFGDVAHHSPGANALGLCARSIFSFRPEASVSRWLGWLRWSMIAPL